MPTLTYQKTVNAAYLLAAAGVLTMPEVAYGALLDLGYFMLKFAQYLFKISESALEHLVGYIFHAEVRKTKIIVFYIILAIDFGVIYYLCRLIHRIFCRLIQNLQASLISYKSRYIAYWAESAANKFKLIAGCNVVLSFIYLIKF